MNLRPRRRPSVNIDMAPLIDVVFLLLIFFMVSATFRDEARLRVRLPEAQGAPPTASTPDSIRIAIDRAGHFYVNDRSLPDERPATLIRTLAAASAPDSAERPSVLIQADASTPHQAVMTAMDAASQAGFDRIAFAATRPAETPAATREP